MKTMDEAVALLPSGSEWSSSFGYPGEGGYVAYYRTPDGQRWAISNGPHYLNHWEFDWQASLVIETK